MSESAEKFNVQLETLFPACYRQQTKKKPR
uniref:Uncharacterized protein n=1 Tax=Rhizophora mucronata TaxID=61149 RepID=A0A2P2P1Z6_RHIMU